MGPILIKNDLAEARETVEKRLEFINGEMYVYFWYLSIFRTKTDKNLTRTCDICPAHPNNCSKKTELLLTKNEEQSEQLAMKIQEMQSALQKAAVEAAKAAAQQAV